MKPGVRRLVEMPGINYIDVCLYRGINKPVCFGHPYHRITCFLSSNCFDNR